MACKASLCYQDGPKLKRPNHFDVAAFWLLVHFVALSTVAASAAVAIRKLHLPEIRSGCPVTRTQIESWLKDEPEDQ